MSVAGIKRLGLAVTVLAVVAPAAPAAALEVVYREQTGVVEEGTQQSVGVNCPDGMNVAGGGGWAAGGFGAVTLNSTYPVNLDGWRTYYDSHGGDVLYRAHVTCLERTPVIRTRDDFASTGGSAERKRCQPGRDSTGGGVLSSGNFGQSETMQTTFGYSRGRTQGPHYWQGVIQNTSSNPVIGSMPWAVYVVCHRGLDIRCVHVEEILRKGKRATLVARCNDDEKILSGGGGGASLEIYVRSTFPFDSPADGDKKPDDGWKVVVDNTDTQREIVFNYAACAAS